MAYTEPTTQTNGTLIDATIYNRDLVDNISYLNANKLAKSGDTLTDVSVSGVAPSTPTAGTLYRDSLLSVWVSVSYSGGTPSIVDDYNVSSLTDNGNGHCQVNFATSLNSTYACMATLDISSPRLIATVGDTTAKVEVQTFDLGGGNADINFYLGIVGGWQ